MSEDMRLHVIFFLAYRPTTTDTVFDPQLVLNVTLYVPSVFFDLIVNVAKPPTSTD